MIGRCFHCGEVLSDKFEEFDERKIKLSKSTNNAKKALFDTNYNNDVGKILDDMNIKKICCRMRMIGKISESDMLGI